MEDSYIELSKYFKLPEFTLYDFSACLVVTFFIFFVASTISKQYRRFKFYKKYFLLGLTAKVIGGLAFALVYTYYYTYGGDTSGYWGHGFTVSQVMFRYPQYWWEVFFRDFSSSESFVLDLLYSIRWSRSTEEYRVIQITSLVAPLGLMNFFASTIVMAAISYIGVWRLFLVFRERFPYAEKGLAFAVLFFPTIVFWGSGIMKDTIVFSCLGLLIYALHNLFKNGFFQINHLAVGAFAAFLIFSIKPYILFSLIPGIIIWRSFQLKDRIKSKFFRSLSIPIVVVVGFVGSLYVLNEVGKYNDAYSIDNFVASAKSMQGWHYQEGSNTSAQFGRGSSYSLGAYEATPEGVLRKFPAAVNVTFFRPYVWEINTAMQLISAVESQLLFLFFLYVLLKYGIFNFLRIVNNDSFLILMLTFSLIFAFGVGFSAYNFGALARYKIPCIPFFVGLLFIVKEQSKLNKRAKLIAHSLQRNRSTKRHIFVNA